MKSRELSFHHPIAFWLGCVAITIGVLAHLPMFIHASHMNYRMVGMSMAPGMMAGMFLIPVGLALALYGLMPRVDQLRSTNTGRLFFHISDETALNREHWTLVAVLMAAIVVDVMKPATLGFVMPGLTKEYAITTAQGGTLALVALTGTAIGSVIWGLIADLSGRRAAILLSALMFIGTSICGAMPAFTWNLIMCFLMGLSAGGLLPITFTLMAECIPTRHRGWLLVSLGGLGTAAGYLVAAGAAAILEPLFSWRILWILGLPTGLLLILLNRFIPESPRYLTSKGLHQEAHATLQRFSGNQAQPETAVVVEEIPVQEPVTFQQLLRGSYTGITLGLVAAGIAWGLVSFGFLLWLPTNLGAIGMAEQANTIIAQSAVLALPCVVLVIWLYHHWSSIKALLLFGILTSLTLCLFVVLDWLDSRSILIWSGTIALLLVSSSGVIAMLMPYAAEIFPVHLRGTGVGIVAASSKIGGILGAVLGVLGAFEHMALSAMMIIITLLISTAMLARSGIDTRGLRLEDVQAAIYRKSAPQSLAEHEV